MSLQAPLTDINANLQNLDCVMIHKKVLNSDFLTSSDPEHFGIAVVLWIRSWAQVPAGSLPDDDRALASFANFGRDVQGWKNVREKVLHGWIRCSDGRLYHPVMAEVVNMAWSSHRQHLYSRKAQTMNKRNNRHPDNKVDVPTFAEWIKAGCPDDLGSIVGLPAPRRGRRPNAEKQAKNAPVSADNPQDVAGQASDPVDPPKRAKKPEQECPEAEELVNYWESKCRTVPLKDEARAECVMMAKKLISRVSLEELKTIVDYVVNDPYHNGERDGNKRQGFKLLFGRKMSFIDDYLERARNMQAKLNKDSGNVGNEVNRGYSAEVTAKIKAYTGRGCTISADGVVTSPTGSIIDKLPV